MAKKNNISVVSGGFDPLHSGHISYLNEARKYSDFLIVLLNSDKWLEKKKGKYFLPFNERKEILENMSMVDKVFSFEDDDLGTCKKGLLKIKKLYPDRNLIFCNGGDRNEENIPETVTCFNPRFFNTLSILSDPNILIRSSSKLIKNFVSPGSPCLPDLPLS